MSEETVLDAKRSRLIQFQAGMVDVNMHGSVPAWDPYNIQCQSHRRCEDVLYRDGDANHRIA